MASLSPDRRVSPLTRHAPHHPGRGCGGKQVRRRLWISSAFVVHGANNLYMSHTKTSEMLDITRPFTRGAALAAGISGDLLSGKKFERLFRGVYVAAATARNAPPAWLRAAGALALHPPDAFASHLSAGRLLRIPVPDDPTEHVSVQDSSNRRPRPGPGLVSHIAPAHARVIRRSGLRVSAPFPLFVELASLLSLVNVVTAGDALVRRHGVSIDELQRYRDAATGPHAARARRAAGFVRAEVDSPRESWLRMLIVLAGLPEPEVNIIIRNERGEVLRRYDTGFRNQKLIVEYDGRQHAESTKQWHTDIERREELDRRNWRIITVTDDDLTHGPAQTLDRVAEAMRLCGVPGVPTRLKKEWRRHFPVR